MYYETFAFENGIIYKYNNYDENNNVTKLTQYNQDGTENTEYSVVYGDYDKFGNPGFSQDGYSKTESKYDEYGREIYRSSYINNALESITETEYDDDGNILKRTIYDANKNMTNEYIYEYVEIKGKKHAVFTDDMGM